MRALLIAALLLAAPAIAVAEPASAVSRNYDVRDLIIYIPDFTDAPTIGLEKEELRAMAPVVEPNRDEIGLELVKSVILLLRGDPKVKVSEKSGMLHVVATAEQQERVKATLDRARRDLYPQVNVAARFITIHARTIDELDAKTREALDDVMFADVMRTVSPGQLAEVLKTAEKDAEPTTILTSPAITVFQGQRAYVMATSGLGEYVSGYAIVEANGKKSGFKPIHATASSGLVFDVRASMSDDRSAVSLDLRAQLVEFADFKSERWPKSPADQNLMIDVPVLDDRRIHRLLTIPNGRCAVLRLQSDRARAEASGLHTFVFVTPTILSQP